MRRASELPPETALFEIRVGERSPLAGQRLREVRLPRETLVVSINRQGETVFPTAETSIEVGDLVMLLVAAESEPGLREYLEG